MQLLFLSLFNIWFFVVSPSSLAFEKSTLPMEKHVKSSPTEEEKDFVITRKKLNDTLKYAWFTKAYEAYKPDEGKIKLLKKARKHLRFVVFGGAWCDDTHMWLPKFYKFVEMAKIRKKDVKLYGVDRDKKPVGNLKDKTLPDQDYKVDRVPTFIVYYDDKEVGRIIESVRNSVEDDILKIVDKAAAENKK